MFDQQAMAMQNSFYDFYHLKREDAL